MDNQPGGLAARASRTTDGPAPGLLATAEQKHSRATPAASGERRSRKQAFKKLPEEVEKLHQAYPEASIELWNQDEHRIGLKPLLRRVWARKGTRVRTVVRPRSQWMYLYGFVEPQSGKASWLLMPTVNTAA